jgi:solute carrier family 6 GABA transporter-like protein 1
MPILLRYISGPVLAIIYSFAYPEFHTLRYDPMMIAGFILAHITMLVVILGFTIPRYYDAFIPMERRMEGTESTVAMETKGEIGGRSLEEAEVERGMGMGIGAGSSDSEGGKDGKGK